MTLTQIWEQEHRDITSVARRAGRQDQDCYVSLGHDSLEEAIKKPLSIGALGYADMIADDWNVVG
jgi:hypothetical protein